MDEQQLIAGNPNDSGDSSGGGTPPEMPSGDSSGGTPPEMPSGDTSGGGTPPEMPSGDSSGGTPPEMPSGDSSGGTPPEMPSGGTGGDWSSTSISYSAATSITAGGTFDNQTFTSSTSGENAILIATNENVVLTNPTVEKTGGTSASDKESFYGTNSAILATGGGSTSIVGGNVTTSAAGANGIFSYGGNGGTNGAAGDGTTVYVEDVTISTTGNGSGGIMTTGGGVTVAKNLTINTSGRSSAAIRTDRGGGTVSVSGGSYTSSGLGSPAIYSTADVTVEGATLTSELSEGVCIEGQNSVALTNCTLTANNTATNGNAQFLDAVILYQSMSGDAASGTASFTMTGGKLVNTSGHLFHVTNTNAVISLDNVTIDDSGDGVILSVCDDGWSGASNVATLNASNQTLKGDILVGDDSTLTLNISDGSTFTGNISGVITNNAGTSISSELGTVNVSLDSSSKWYLTADTYVTNFDGDAANVITGNFKLYENNVEVTGTTETESSEPSGDTVVTAVNVNNTVNNTLVSGTALDDTITNSGAQVSIQAYAGDDTINNSGDNVVIFYARGDGTDFITGFDDNDTLSISGGSYTRTSSGDDLILTVGSGRITLEGAGSLSTINIDGTGSGTASGSSGGHYDGGYSDGGGSSGSIGGGSGGHHDSGGSGSSGSGSGSGSGGGTGGGTSGGPSTSDGSGGDHSTAGAGSSSNNNTSSSSSTSSGGNGSDLLQEIQNKINSTGGVTNLSSGGTRYVTDTRTTTSTSSTSTTRTTSTSTTTTTSTPTYTSTTTTTSTPTNTTTTPVPNHVYAGGNQVITNYNSGEKIVFGGQYTGAAYDAAGNLIVGSSTGALGIANAVGKVVDLVDGNGNSFLKAYAATAPGVIDGRGLTGFELINGSAGADIIQAGDGGSQLWGGADNVSDILLGGGGTDIFVGGKNFGADAILNASAADVVNFGDATLSDIVATASDGNAVGIAFNTGNVVTVQSTDVLSAAVQLADGSAYRYNNATKSWQTA